MINRTLLNRLFTDIRFWILLYFLIRLVGITNAPLEVAHNWRQSLTNMVARNFLDIDANIFYPRIDMAGEKTGIIGTEFPLFNYLIYLVSSVFGYTHWYGRLINLIVSSLGTYAFFLLIKKLFSDRIAFFSTLVFLASIWFSFSRKIMPDTFSVSLMLIGILFSLLYMEKGGWLNLSLFFIFSTLGMLCKIPALSLLPVVGILLLDKKFDRKNRIYIFITSGVAVAVTFLWYFYWVPTLVETFRYQLYFPKGIIEGMSEIRPYLFRFLEKFFFSSLNSFIGFACFLVGIYYFFRNENLLAKAGFLLTTLVFLLFAIKTGAVFPLHNYYIIPFAPVMALLAGYALSKFNAKIAIVVVILISIEGISNQNQDFFIKENQRYKVELERVADGFIPKDKLIIVNGGASPQLIYFANRKGWTVDELVTENQVDSLYRLGASYLIIDNHKLTRRFSYNFLYADESFTLYKLD
ncbi:MAG: hypothetical protein HGA37_05470 [Lentimicrobium sp.]|nr:hypothetical protein [Lentimicrobium sp.]